MLALALQITVVLFMVGSLAGVGLGLSPRDALGPLRNIRFMGASLLASWVVTPAVAWALVQVIPLDRPYATGLLLLALAPCAPFAPTMARTAGGQPAAMAAFMVVSAVTTVVFMPMAVPFLVEGLEADPVAIARPLLLFVLLPLLLGMTLHGARPQAAERLKPTVERVANAAALLLLVLIGVMYGQGVIDAIGSYAIGTQVVFLLLITGATHWLGAGLAPEQRSVVTIGVCTRNLGAALAPLMAVGADPRAIVMIAISLPATLLVSALVARRLGRRHRAGGLVPEGAS